jgi:hypothetical protein
MYRVVNADSQVDAFHAFRYGSCSGVTSYIPCVPTPHLIPITMVNGPTNDQERSAF